MFKNLSPGAIGVSASLKEGLRLAQLGGFQGLDVNLGEVKQLAAEHSVEAVKGWFEEAGIQPGGCGLTVPWNADEAVYRKGLAELPDWAYLMQGIGCTRMVTWLPSWSDEKPYAENFAFHVERFRPIASILQDYGGRLGLEFLGPKTLREGHRYNFVHTLDGLLALAAAIGTGNVGLLLDAWHWYTAHGTLDEVQKLSNNDVVYVHTNDAPAGIPIDEQIDHVRCLPGETGVIDLVGFYKALHDIGYDGPVTPEPFSQKVRALSTEEAVKMTGEYLDKAWREAGLS